MNQRHDDESAPSAPILQCGPDRAVTHHISYKGIVCVKRETNNMFQNNCAYIGQLDLDELDFISMPACRFISSTQYVSTGNPLEFHQPYVFSAKVKSYKQDNLTYNDIL